MPSCNLSETIHAAWSKQSGKVSDNIYEVSVEDFARGFIQCTRYNAFLKGRASGTGPTKEELRLRAATRTGNLKYIYKAMEGIPGSEEYLLATPGYVGEEVFGSAKRRLDVEPGAIDDSHRFDKVNFSHPKNAAKSMRRTVESSPSSSAPPELPVDTTPTLVFDPSIVRQEEVVHVSSVQESECKEDQWHIRRIPSMGKKSCMALQARTGRRCTAKLRNSTPAPAYYGVFHVRTRRNDFPQFFYFCPDDLARCVGGKKRQHVVARPVLPTVWPVQRGTNLSIHEVMSLEEAGFQLQQRQPLPEERQFGNNHAILRQIDNISVPEDAAKFPLHRNERTTRRNLNRPIPALQLTRWESSKLVDATITNVTLVPSPGIGAVINLVSRHGQESKEYKVNIGPHPECSCLDFKEMIIQFRKRGAFYNCKHLYYIYRIVCGMRLQEDRFIHACSLSFNEIKQLLVSGIAALIVVP